MATEDVDKCPDELTCLTAIAKPQSGVYLRDREPNLKGLGGNLYLPLGMRLPRGWELPESWRKK